MVDEVQDRMGEEVDLWAHGENQLNSTQLNNLLFFCIASAALKYLSSSKIVGYPTLATLIFMDNDAMTAPDDWI